MVRYSDELIDEIRSNNDIVDVISQYVTLKRSGRNFFGLCPFHKEKSPSFSVSSDKQIFHCFGCGVGGDVFRFISKIENVDFREAVGVLADRAGINLPTLGNAQDNELQKLKSRVYEINEIAANLYHENLYKPTAKQAQDYIKKRKLDNTTLKNFTIGYAGNFNELYKELVKRGYTEKEILASSLVNKSPNGQFVDRFKNRLMFPIKDIRDRVIAFGGRVLDDSKPKYINSPENIVYSKGKHLFGLNVAKRQKIEELIIVEGYMDAISLHQRGISNVVASLGTALTDAQARLLRKYGSKIILGYDADGAGQAAILRGLEILKGIGCDVRVLQIEGAKDPDEFVIKYGTGRFNMCVEKAISLVEFKVKILKNSLNIENANDKIKFLNEVSKVIAEVDNTIEKEVYIENISKEYGISKEAIYAQCNKLSYANNQGTKILENNNLYKSVKKTTENIVTDAVIKRENMLISLLVNPENNIYQRIKDYIKPEDFKEEKNKRIIEKIYNEYETNSNINNMLDIFDKEEDINHITYIMADDYDVSNIDKSIEDIIKIYEKEKVIEQKNIILKKLENTNLDKQEARNLEKELSEIIVKLAKMK